MKVWLPSEKTWRHLVGLSFALITVTANAWSFGLSPKSYHVPEFRGSVTDQATGKPVPGAVVVLKGEGRQDKIVDSQTACYYADLAVTNENGRFVFPEKTIPVDGHSYLQDAGSHVVEVFKPGYIRYFPNNAWSTEPQSNLFIAPLPDEKHYLISLSMMSSEIICAFYPYSGYKLSGEKRLQIISFFGKLLEETERQPQSEKRDRLISTLKLNLRDFKVDGK